MQWIFDHLELILGALGVLVMIGRFVAPFTATKIDDFIVDALDALLKLTRGKLQPEKPVTHEEQWADRKIEPPAAGSSTAALKDSMDAKIAGGFGDDKP